eukprot:gb/GECG01003200.1/.p1 GENE.gb/GECG01003200.1/~~gb/GECG01003200.1/.p1  ORF type:complete len:284 (+),score=40.57 gb/GECG01003200.1/:1-852(+)
MDLEAIRRVAERGALQAGRHFRDKAGNTAVEALKDGSQDLVTAVDKECQNIVEESIKQAFPQHAILGEESVESGSEASAAAIEKLSKEEWLWIIDPIDGTTNFIHGLPLSVVSIGVAHKGTMVAGVIYDPYRDELFSAVKGKGATCNNKPIHVSKEPELKDAVVAFSTHHTPEMASLMLRGAGEVATRARSVRSLGCAAIHLAWVAAGKLSAFWELDLSIWDIAAGCLLVQEAGGRVGETSGEEFSLHTRDTLASNGNSGVHDTLLRLLEQVDAHKGPTKRKQ